MQSFITINSIITLACASVNFVASIATDSLANTLRYAIQPSHYPILYVLVGILKDFSPVRNLLMFIASVSQLSFEGYAPPPQTYSNIILR